MEGSAYREDQRAFAGLDATVLHCAICIQSWQLLWEPEIFQFGTQYIKICTLISAVQILMDLLSTKLKCRNRQNREQLYTVVGTATEQYKVV